MEVCCEPSPPFRAVRMQAQIVVLLYDAIEAGRPKRVSEAVWFDFGGGYLGSSEVQFIPFVVPSPRRLRSSYASALTQLFFNPRSAWIVSIRPSSSTRAIPPSVAMVMIVDPPICCGGTTALTETEGRLGLPPP